MAKEDQQEMMMMLAINPTPSGRRCPPSFFQNFSSSDLSSERLKIPVGFINHMEGKTSGLISIMGPSGDFWQVDLVQENGNVFLDNGWPTFVRDHFLECGDLLIFRYDGQFCFSVQVFDQQSSCEKEVAFHSKCSQDPGTFCARVRQKRQREEEAASSDKNKKVRGSSCELYSECIDKNWEAQMDTSDTGRHQQDVITTEESFYHETKRYGNSAKSFAVTSQSKPCNEKPEKRIGKEDDFNQHDKGYVSSFSEREKRVAQSFISCFPYFVRIMKKFNISGSYTLNIPYQFSTAHLPNCKTEIVLRTIKGACWTVNSVPTTRVHTSHTLCGGWMAFVRSNDINVGDVCIFELLRKFELRVFILRVGKEGSHNETGKVASNGVNAGCAVTAHKIKSFPKKLRRKSLQIHSKLIKDVEIYDEKGSKESQAVVFSNHSMKQGNATKGSASATLCSHSGSGNEKQEAPTWKHRTVEAELSSQAGAAVRMMIALDEKRAAKSFTSTFPYFVRIMRKFNVSGSYTLKIPHQFSSAHLPNCKSEIILHNVQGECWTVNSLPDSKGRAVHTFCGGWMAFVRDNDIKMGDICMFELVSKCEMRVRISVVGRLAVDHRCGKSASNNIPLVTVSSNCFPF